MNVLAQSEPGSWAVPAAIMVGVGLLLAITGRFVMSIADRAADGQLGPNALAGVRTRATTASPEAWLVAHRAARSPTKVGGLAIILAGPVSALFAVLLASDDPDRALAIWGSVLTALAIVAVIPIVLGAVRGHRAAKEHTATVT